MWRRVQRPLVLQGPRNCCSQWHKGWESTARLAEPTALPKELLWWLSSSCRSNWKEKWKIAKGIRQWKAIFEEKKSFAKDSSLTEETSTCLYGGRDLLGHGQFVNYTNRENALVKKINNITQRNSLSRLDRNTHEFWLLPRAVSTAGEIKTADKKTNVDFQP